MDFEIDNMLNLYFPSSHCDFKKDIVGSYK